MFITSEQLKTDGLPDGAKVSKHYDSLIKAVNTETRTVDFVISNEEVDRDGDIVSLKGWDLSHFKKNPVVLFGHDHNSPPIAKAPNV